MVGTIKVLVVDDSMFMRRIITDILVSDPLIEVVGQAADGIAALQLIAQLKPDVVLLDFEMPKLDGLETLKRIENLSQQPIVIMVSGHTEKDSQITWECLRAGAVDYLLKPSGTLSVDMFKVKEILLDKIKIAVRVTRNSSNNFEQIQVRRVSDLDKRFGAVVIGSSTGGPAALQVLLANFPADFPLPILVAQHLPKQFTKTLSERLNRNCQLRVIEAENGMSIEAGSIYLAPGGCDMTVEKSMLFRVSVKIENCVIQFESPSVDTLMMSIAEVYKRDAIGVILTGMGRDGVIGMEAIKRSGGKTIVQDENSSVVYGMGMEVVARGLADDIVPLDCILDKIMEIIS